MEIFSNMEINVAQKPHPKFVQYAENFFVQSDMEEIPNSAFFFCAICTWHNAQ